ncbi:MAG: hypothetical protein ACO3F3_03885 [Gemmataceae bacterium]
MNRTLIHGSVMALVLALVPENANAFAEPGNLPTLKQAIASKQDLYGQLAMSQPNGPSYEFFENILPPPRYVNADFRHYPLLLSAPMGKVKARLISNGSGMNLRGGSRSWRDVGKPVLFRVGPDEFQFGGIPGRVRNPQWLEGWLPVAVIDYVHPSPFQSEGAVPIDQKVTQRELETYRLEAFADTSSFGADHGLVMVKFTLIGGTQGKVAVQADGGKSTFKAGTLKDAENQTVLQADKTWTFQRGMLHANLKKGESATMAIFTKPPADDGFLFQPGAYEKHLQETVKEWRSLVARATQVHVPEPRVNHAWKNLLVQNFMMIQGDKMFYSASNQYEQLYSAEGSEAVLAMLAWNYGDLAKKLMVPIFDFSRKGLEHHQAGIKLLDVIRVWGQTKDREWVVAMQPRWERELQKILKNRDQQNGLLPKERYCGDISTPVHSLSVDAKAWRVLRDIQPMLADLKLENLLAEVRKAENEYRVALLKAVRSSIRKETNPPFITIALLDKEEPHSPITATRIGSYWNIINGFVLASRIFPAGSAEENYLGDYIENHGGIFMGMTRSGGTAHGFWTGPERINPLYGSRYSMDLLRRDQPEKFLVGFYGMLAQGFTRDTFLGGEGCTLDPVDDGGRFFYCPPNSAANGFFLGMLRNQLVQELDMDDDGKPETLRLAFATSRRWMEDGKSLAVQKAPTAFGEVSFQMESRLKDGKVLVQLDLPEGRTPEKTFLRLRLPEGWKIASCVAKGQKLPFQTDGTTDISSFKGKLEMEYQVAR